MSDDVNYHEPLGRDDVTSAGARRSPSGFGRARAAFRRWRRGRPFWGGLFTIFGGAWILFIAKAPLPLILHSGIGGISGMLMGALMILMGLVLWYQPHLRTIAGIATILFSLTSFVTSNLGGFLIGMLFGIVGGSLGFAWSPERNRTVAESKQDTPAEDGMVAGAEPADGGPARSGAEAGDRTLSDELFDGFRGRRPDEGPDEGLHDGTDEGRGEDPHEVRDEAPRDPHAGPRMLAVALVPALLFLAGGLASVGLSDPTASPAAAASPTPTSGETGTDAATVSPSPDPTADEPSSTPSQEPTSEATPTPTPTSTPSPDPSCEVKASDLPTKMPRKGAEATKELAEELEPCFGKNETGEADAGAAQSSFPADTAVLTADLMTMTNLYYRGVVDLTVSGGATVRAMKFTADTLTLTNSVQTAKFGSNQVVHAVQGESTLSGHITMYATKMSGNLLGILPITFSPDGIQPPALPLPVIFFTSTTSVIVQYSGDTLHLPKLDQRAS